MFFHQDKWWVFLLFSKRPLFYSQDIIHLYVSVLTYPITINLAQPNLHYWDKGFYLKDFFYYATLLLSSEGLKVIFSLLSFRAQRKSKLVIEILY